MRLSDIHFSTTKKIDPKFYKVTNDSIKFKKEICILIPNIGNAVKINETAKTVLVYANFPIYMIDEDGATQKIEIFTNRFLTVKYATKEETQDSIFLFVTANNNIFKDNLSVNSVDNAYAAFNLLLSGKLDKILKTKYRDLLPALMDIMEKNEIDGNSPLSYEIAIAELCASEKDKTKSFRFSAETDSTQSEFVFLNIRDVPRNVSSFSAVSAENISSGVASSILNSKLGNTSKLTPVEQISLSKL